MIVASLPPGSQSLVVLALAGVMAVAGRLIARLAFRPLSIGHFVFQFAAFFVFTALLMAGGAVPFSPTPVDTPTYAYVFISLLKIFWWFGVASLIVGVARALLAFRRQPGEIRFLQDLVAGVIYAGALVALVADVFEISVTGLLAASGVVAIVLGLALQSTLGDVFSGVVLNLSRPYRPGDWITLDGGMQGRVIEISWRATHLLTLDNDLAIVPNSLVAKSRLVNASQPMKGHAVNVRVRLEPTMTPSFGYAVLQTTLLSCNRILRTPAATVSVMSLDAAAVEYEIQFFVTAIEIAPEAQNELFDLVFRHLASAGLRLARPAVSPAAYPRPVEHRDSADAPRRLLDHLPIFAPLSDAERIALAPKMKRRTHQAGDVLVKQGSIAHALCILTSGVLVAVQKVGNGEEEALRLAPGDSFGEAGLLAGAATMFEIRALTKATTYEIDKADIAPILKQRPAIASALGEVLAQRQAVGKARLEDFADRNKPEGTLAARLSEHVRDVFGLV